VSTDHDHAEADVVDESTHHNPWSANLVTHGDNGHPSEYLFDALADDVDWEYVEQCGCGGHVTRVHV